MVTFMKWGWGCIMSLTASKIIVKQQSVFVKVELKDEKHTYV